MVLNRKMKADKTLMNFLEENVAKKDVSKDAKDAIRANFRSAYALYVAMPPQKEETDERRDEDILQHITAKGFDDVAIARQLRKLDIYPQNLPRQDLKKVPKPNTVSDSSDFQFIHLLSSICKIIFEKNPN